MYLKILLMLYNECLQILTFTSLPLKESAKDLTPKWKDKALLIICGASYLLCERIYKVYIFLAIHTWAVYFSPINNNGILSSEQRKMSRYYLKICIVGYLFFSCGLHKPYYSVRCSFCVCVHVHLVCVLLIYYFEVYIVLLFTFQVCFVCGISKPCVV